MTPFDKLACVIAARTKGDWQHIHISPGHDPVTICNVDTGKHHLVCTATCEQNGIFTALMGSIADELLAVVQAAEGVRDSLAMWCTYNGRLKDGSLVQGVETMDEALEALKAKLGGRDT